MTILPFVSRSTKALRARLQARRKARLDARLDALLAKPFVRSPDEHEDFVRWNAFVPVTIRGDDLRLPVGLSTPRYPDKRPPMGNVPALPLATLVDECRLCEDPVALSMLVVRCMQEDAGAHLPDAITLAQRWTDLEPENHLAWVVLATIFWRARDTDKRR